MEGPCLPLGWVSGSRFGVGASTLGSSLASRPQPEQTHLGALAGGLLQLPLGTQTAESH